MTISSYIAYCRENDIDNPFIDTSIFPNYEPFDDMDYLSTLESLIEATQDTRLLSARYYNSDRGIPDVDKIRAKIALIAKTKEYTINGLWKTIGLDYNPIENYDRYEDITETGTGSDTLTKSEYIDTNSIGQIVTQNNIGASGGTNKTSVSPMENESFYAKDKNEYTTNEQTNTITESPRTNSLAHGQQKETTERGSGIIRKAHLHGNIGVTTAGQMIAEQRQVVIFDWYLTVAKLLIDGICIKVWGD